jgi:signal transduction histidine kinase
MSHEVRNPLHVIGLLVEDMMATIKSGEMITLHDLEVVLHSSMRASRFVERLLEFTKQGKSSSQQIERLNISDAFKNPIILGETLYKRRQMQLIFEPTDLPYIYGSRDSLEQVFLNLIVNAADAMSAGGQLRITTHIVGKELEISFEDTGVGIAPDHLEKIFEPSFTTKEQGTGIGLFISYEIISNHNGSIDVESTVGKGTRFIVRLPLSD